MIYARWRAGLIDTDTAASVEGLGAPARPGSAWHRFGDALKAEIVTGAAVELSGEIHVVEGECGLSLAQVAS